MESESETNTIWASAKEISPCGHKPRPAAAQVPLPRSLSDFPTTHQSPPAPIQFSPVPLASCCSRVTRVGSTHTCTGAGWEMTQLSLHRAPRAQGQGGGWSNPASLDPEAGCSDKGADLENSERGHSILRLRDRAAEPVSGARQTGPPPQKPMRLCKGHGSHVIPLSAVWPWTFR